LSEKADWAEGIERDNENQVMVKREWLEIRVMDVMIDVSWGQHGHG